MKYYKPKDATCIRSDNCFKCKFLKHCFPKTYELRQEVIKKRWKDKHGDEF